MKAKKRATNNNAFIIGVFKLSNVLTCVQAVGYRQQTKCLCCMLL